MLSLLIVSIVSNDIFPAASKRKALSKSVNAPAPKYLRQEAAAETPSMAQNPNERDLINLFTKHIRPSEAAINTAIRNGANINATNYYGNTALHRAAIIGFV